MNKTGRPESISRLVRDAVLSAGPAGASYSEIRASHPALTVKQIRQFTANNAASGRIVRYGQYRHPRFFSPEVDAVFAQAVVDAETADRLKQYADRRQHYNVLLSARRKAERAGRENYRPRSERHGSRQWWGLLKEYISSNPGKTSVEIGNQFDVTRNSAWHCIDTLRLKGLVVCLRAGRSFHVFPTGMSNESMEALMPARPKTEKKAIKQKREKQITKKLAAINAIANKYRGSALPKERARPAPVISGMETAKRTICPPCRGRFEPVAGEDFSVLSALPIGSYAEPAGFVARALLEAA